MLSSALLSTRNPFAPHLTPSRLPLPFKHMWRLANNHHTRPSGTRLLSLLIPSSSHALMSGLQFGKLAVGSVVSQNFVGNLCSRGHCHFEVGHPYEVVGGMVIAVNHQRAVLARDSSGLQLPHFLLGVGTPTSSNVFHCLCVSVKAYGMTGSVPFVCLSRHNWMTGSRLCVSVKA
ncbi:hypothetical protein GWK47_042828 [Chionoecetes opilio]|uniref:Uncharacterized protein n=1 Tax=Chionoecetes opilio TaxID=41210 RepID=A0A8J4YHJ1_CHIOP|nr:hypothetical protein GWK47_042828 [Chionoecetes opilio]